MKLPHKNMEPAMAANDPEKSIKYTQLHKMGIGRILVRKLLSFLLDVHWFSLKCITTLIRHRKPCDVDRPLQILLTGTFYSDNWILNKLRPLSACKYISRIWIVSTYPVPEIDKVKLIYPPQWLCKFFGRTPARLMVFYFMGLRCRPDYVGGFHLLLNGLSSPLLARFINARSIYFNGGGILEVSGGGYLVANPWAHLIKYPDKIIERKLIRAVSAIDICIVRGRKTIKYFNQQGATNRFEIIAGGIDEKKFQDNTTTKEYDLILIGNIIQIKRIDLFLKVIQDSVKELPTLRAVIVGTGPLELSFKNFAQEINISNHVTFVGYQKDVAPWLFKSKVFMLTSDSEGLSQALIEALFCGLPCIVSDVGEHADIIEQGVNGYLVKEQNSQIYTSYLVPLLKDSLQCQRMSLAARRSAQLFNLETAAMRWNDILSKK
jgi:L-malate glycosyltransferase